MTLNDLINSATSIVRQFPSGDIPLDKEIKLDLADDDKGNYFVKVSSDSEEPNPKIRV